MDRRTLGDYRIEGIVGAGGIGVVYLAVDRDSGRAVALKVLREEVSIDPVYRERFRRESALLARLEHPHVIPVHAVGEIDGELFIAMRIVSSTLQRRLAGGPLALDAAFDVLSRVAAALDAAHAAGVVHRDVKPTNVLLDPRSPGSVFLADFGLARDPGAEALTVPGQLIGSIAYMAPELIDGEGVGPATDVYALACMAVETLTGRVPFDRQTDAATMYAHIVDPPPSVQERRPELPLAFDDAIARGMAKDPDDRPAGAGALIVELLRALDRPAPACLATVS